MIEDSKVKVVPRRITLFVGRLEKDTSPEDLADYLKDNGIDDCACKKLADTSKDGKTFRTAAFMVSFDVKFHDLVYDESSWPAGCELRDWIFRERNKSTSAA